MRTELNRRIAEEIMGEPEPPRPNDERLEHARVEQMGEGDGYFGEDYYSEHGNWLMRFHKPWAVDWEFFWVPIPFDDDLALTMRAVNALIDSVEYGHLELTYNAGNDRLWDALALIRWGDPPTELYKHKDEIRPGELAETVCGLVLALKEVSG